uniref:Uncharacterized protein n=1 Tax=Kalanchoe fedtschenkoi TaxID=63787 RepID=A0A7N0V5F7_KALFE
MLFNVGRCSSSKPLEPDKSRRGSLHPDLPCTFLRFEKNSYLSSDARRDSIFHYMELLNLSNFSFESVVF